MPSPQLVYEAQRLGIIPKPIPEFAISRTADWPVAILRERTDRRYVDLERTRPIKSALQWFLHAFGVIGFFGTVFALCFFR